MNSAVIFTTRKESEAKRLLPIVARGNGGVKDFSVEALPSDKPTYAIIYAPSDGILSNAQLQTSRSVAMMSGFLEGFLSAERSAKRSLARESRIREQHRRGRR
jgi:hypothetical protein